MGPRRSSPGEIFVAFLGLGLTAFGGPVAHVGFFREVIVVRRGWLDDRDFTDLVALAQFLPGPASSQVGIAIGATRAGLAGALAAWVGFTAPSAILMALFALVITRVDTGAGWLNGLKLAAVAVVARAVWAMARRLCPDRARASLALVAAVVVIAWPGSGGQMAALLGGALVGWAMLGHDDDDLPGAAPSATIDRRLAVASLAVFAILLAALPLAARLWPTTTVVMVDGFFRAGALIFGGGHVILPMLEAVVVPSGWVDRDVFLAGYGAAQAIPGPLLSFSAYLGMTIIGVAGAALALGAAFLPSFLLVLGVLPFWEMLRRRRAARTAMRGVNAAVVGLLLAALYDPVWIGAVSTPLDVALVLAAVGALALWRMPPWLVVGLCAAAGEIIG